MNYIHGKPYDIDIQRIYNFNRKFSVYQIFDFESTLQMLQTLKYWIEYNKSV